MLLKPYRENEIYRENFTEPPPELVEGEEVYEVETIHSHRKQGRGYQYYVQWQGYLISDASWELEHAFSNDGKILADYKKHHFFCYIWMSCNWLPIVVRKKPQKTSSN